MRQTAPLWPFTFSLLTATHLSSWLREGVRGAAVSGALCIQLHMPHLFYVPLMCMLAFSRSRQSSNPKGDDSQGEPP